MSSAAEQVLQDGLKLSYDERSLVAHELGRSVEEFASPEIEAAWKAEIARRIKEADEGTVEWVSQEEVDRILSPRFLADSKDKADGEAPGS